MIVDILVVIVLFVSALIAFMRGFIRETLTVLGVVGATAAAYSFGGMLVPLMADMLGANDADPGKVLGVIPADKAAIGLAYGLIFLVVVIALSVASHFLAEAAKTIGLGAVDRSMGVVFGLARGVVILGIAYLPFHLLMSNDGKETWFADAKSHLYLEKTAGAIASFLPKGAEESAKDIAGDVQKTTATRARLEEIDLLKKGVVPSEVLAPILKKSKDAAKGAESGYEEDFRSQMDKLFEQQSGQYNE